MEPLLPAKAISITYSECVSVALVMQRIILSSLACPALPYFSTLPHKHYDFSVNDIEHKTCVLIFSTPLLKSFLILRVLQRSSHKQFS